METDFTRLGSPQKPAVSPSAVSLARRNSLFVRSDAMERRELARNISCFTDSDDLAGARKRALAVTSKSRAQRVAIEQMTLTASA